MHQKTVLVVFIIMISILVCTFVLLGSQQAFAEVKLSKPVAVNQSEQKLQSVGLGSAVILEVSIANQNNESVPYVAIIEVRNPDDIVEYLQFQKGTLASQSSTSIGISWTPQIIGTYHIVSFLINDFENPVVLSAMSSTSINVGNITIIDSSTSNTINNPFEESSNQTSIPLTSDNHSSEVLHSLAELKQYALDRINEDRKKSGLSPVELDDSNSAAQVHAEDVLKTKIISHWMTDGEKPYMVYSRYGGKGAVAQNVAMTGDYYYYKDCISGRYQCQRINPFEEIDSNENVMLYNDSACCDNGHRDNILDKYHTDVSIGIAYDDYTFVMVQNFENNYIIYDKPITIDNRTLTFSGKILKGSSNIEADSLSLVHIYYDELPTNITYQGNIDRISYDPGTFVGGVTPDTSYYEHGKTLLASKWNFADSIDLSFDISPIVDKNGVYTVYVYLTDRNGDEFPVTSYSVFVQTVHN